MRSLSVVEMTKENETVPYELPEGWKCCRQNEVCRLSDGEMAVLKV